MKEFEKITVLGGGLLGGSLALALQDRLELALWARREASAASAREMGIRSATTDLKEALSGADLVVLSVPVGAMGPLIELALAHGLSPKSLVTDVGSVKRVVHRVPGEMLAAKGIPFIGGHPMAGSEKRGVEASSKDLFSDAMCFLTDGNAVGAPLTGLLEQFWERLGCRVCWTDAATHDELVARISHFPHLIAAAAARVSLKDPSDARFGGGGLRDTTRVAGGDPEMWAEILMENRAAVSRSVSDVIAMLGEIQSALEEGNHEAIQCWLESAHDLHRKSQSSMKSPSKLS